MTDVNGDSIRYIYDSPANNVGDFAVGEQLFPPPVPTTDQPLRVQRYAQTAWKLAFYLQYWLRRELQSAWTTEIAHIVTQDGSMLGSDICPLVPASFVPIDQWNTSTLITFPHLNVIRTSTRAIMESTELPGTLNTYGCTYILPPATSIDLADLYAQFCSAIADVVIASLPKNSIDGQNRWFTTENKLEEQFGFGRLKTPATAENWLNAVTFDIQIRNTIYAGTGYSNAVPFEGATGTVASPNPIPVLSVQTQIPAP